MTDTEAMKEWTAKTGTWSDEDLWHAAIAYARTQNDMHEITRINALHKAATTFASYAIQYGNEEIPDVEKVVANVNLSNEMTAAININRRIQ